MAVWDYVPLRLRGHPMDDGLSRSTLVADLVSDHEQLLVSDKW